MIVVDASVVIDLLLEERTAVRIAQRLLDGKERLQAPHLIDVEVAQVLRRVVRARDVEAARARLAMLDFLELPIERHSHVPLLERVWELRDSLSAYDAAYVALAELLDAPLLTRDSKLKRAHGHRAKIEVI